MTTYNTTICSASSDHVALVHVALDQLIGVVDDKFLRCAAAAQRDFEAAYNERPNDIRLSRENLTRLSQATNHWADGIVPGPRRLIDDLNRAADDAISLDTWFTQRRRISPTRERQRELGNLLAHVLYALSLREYTANFAHALPRRWQRLEEINGPKHESFNTPANPPAHTTSPTTH